MAAGGQNKSALNAPETPKVPTKSESTIRGPLKSKVPAVCPSDDGPILRLPEDAAMLSSRTVPPSKVEIIRE
jgi:hypothetical protein